MGWVRHRVVGHSIHGLWRWSASSTLWSTVVLVIARRSHGHVAELMWRRHPSHRWLHAWLGSHNGALHGSLSRHWHRVAHRLRHWLASHMVWRRIVATLATSSNLMCLVRVVVAVAVVWTLVMRRTHVWWVAPVWRCSASSAIWNRHTSCLSIAIVGVRIIITMRRIEWSISASRLLWLLFLGLWL